MNPETNELVDCEAEAFRKMADELESGMVMDDLLEVARSRAALDLERLKTEGFQEVPQKLEHAARCALRGRGRATVSKQSKGKLSKWAAGQRGKR